jgi:hypothetical protein
VLSRKHQLENLTQLSWLCACGRRPLELKGPGFCRVCYYRRYHSLRFFGGLREAVLRRDRFRCRVCGIGAPLLVHHRDGHNERRLLITLCISCHVRLHRYRGFSRWIPKVLLELWSEIHPGQPLQLQLPFAISARAADEKAGPTRTVGTVTHGLFYRRAECQAASR